MSSPYTYTLGQLGVGELIPSGVSPFKVNKISLLKLANIEKLNYTHHYQKTVPKSIEQVSVKKSCGGDIFLRTLAELVTPSLVLKTFVNVILVPLWEYFRRIESFFLRYIPGLVSDIAKMYCGRDIFLCHCRLS